jgi:hypothetical protein
MACISRIFLLPRAKIHPFRRFLIDDDAFAKVIVAMSAEHGNYMFLVASPQSCYRLRDVAKSKPYQEEKGPLYLTSRRTSHLRVALRRRVTVRGVVDDEALQGICNFLRKQAAIVFALYWVSGRPMSFSQHS